MLKSYHVKNVETGDKKMYFSSSPFEACLWAYSQNELSDHTIGAYQGDDRVQMVGDRIVFDLPSGALSVPVTATRDGYQIGPWANA